jgi:hypothetical protein
VAEALAHRTGRSQPGSNLAPVHFPCIPVYNTGVQGFYSLLFPLCVNHCFGSESMNPNLSDPWDQDLDTKFKIMILFSFNCNIFLTVFGHTWAWIRIHRFNSAEFTIVRV